MAQETPEKSDRAPPIADYALIGDCHSTALVGRDGSIDWACLRRFDASPVFARLIDWQQGGSFRVVARGLVSRSRRYLPDTNVLETLFVTSTGTLRLVDAFVMRAGGSRHPAHQLLRRLECVEGSVEVEILIEPRFDYCTLHPGLLESSPQVFVAAGGDDAFVLWTDGPLVVDREAVAFRGAMSLARGQAWRFSLVSARPEQLDLKPLAKEAFDSRLDETIGWWQRWTARGEYPEPHREVIVRSALLLKLLTCGPTGAIVAAPTTSLPEWIGGERNWDYRYAWVRDSSMTMSALVSVGHPEVAEGLWRFLERSSAGAASELRVMYGCHGTRRLPEVSLDHLAGYRNSKPVRVGNAAHLQLQLDVYGDLVNAAWLWHRSHAEMDADSWLFLKSVVDEAAGRWREPDCGIWEIRGEPQHFVYSKAMCCMALQRGIELAETLGLAADVDRWKAEARAIRESIEVHGIRGNPPRFVQAYGSNEVDASLLRLALMGFVPADDPRFQSTVDAIRAELSAGDWLLRYRSAEIPEGVSGREGAFVACAFWLVDVLAMQGRMPEAAALFAKLLESTNDLGLISEELNPETGELLGNFPQAFSHTAIINAAQQLQPDREQAHRRRPISERHSRSNARSGRGARIGSPKL